MFFGLKFIYIFSHLFMYLFVHLFEQLFSYPAACTITDHRVANFDLCLARMAFRSEGSLTCHTCCDMGPLLCKYGLTWKTGAHVPQSFARISNVILMFIRIHYGISNSHTEIWMPDVEFLWEAALMGLPHVNKTRVMLLFTYNVTQVPKAYQFFSKMTAIVFCIQVQ
jgi:hypothetical protein